MYLIVDGDAIGPADTDVDEDGSLRSIQARAFDAGILAPLCPEQVAARAKACKDRKPNTAEINTEINHRRRS